MLLYQSHVHLRRVMYIGIMDSERWPAPVMTMMYHTFNCLRYIHLADVPTASFDQQEQGTYSYL